MVEIWSDIIISIGIVIIICMIFYVIKIIIEIKNKPKHTSIREMFRIKGIENKDTEVLIRILEEHSEKLRKKAVEIARRNGHRKVTSEDMKQAIDEI